jgi:hypothetical protein
MPSHNGASDTSSSGTCAANDKDRLNCNGGQVSEDTRSNARNRITSVSSRSTVVPAIQRKMSWCAGSTASALLLDSDNSRKPLAYVLDHDIFRTAAHISRCE